VGAPSTSSVPRPLIRSFAPFFRCAVTAATRSAISACACFFGSACVSPNCANTVFRVTTEAGAVFLVDALYEIETDDLKQTLATLGARSGTSAMVMSDALAEQRLAWVFDPVTPVVTKKS
jgi:hypothetical protein